MASRVAAEANSRLRRALSTLERRTRLPSPYDIDDLKKAAQRRGHDYATVQNVLEDLTDLEEEDGWMLDFLNIDGNSKHELAKILVDEKHDSPWIFRPTCFDAVSVEDLTSSSSTCIPFAELDSSAPRDQLLQNEADALEFSMHTLSLQQNRNLEEGGNNVLDLGWGKFIANDNSGPVSSLPAFTDWTFGIAGYLPVEFKRFPTYETQHEAWLEEWHRNVEIDSTGNEMSVSYASESSLDLDGMKCLANRTHFALRKLLETLTTWRREKQSFNQLLVPTVSGATDAVRIVRLELSIIEEISASLLNYTTTLFRLYNEQEPLYAERNFETIRAVGATVGLGTISFLLPLLLPMALAVDFGIVAAAAARDREKRILSAQLHKLVEYRKSLVSITKRLFQSLVDSVPNQLFFERVHYSREELSLDLEQNTLHLAAMIVQTLCLALQSYSQAHTGEFEFSCLDHPIQKVNLLGGGEKWVKAAQGSQRSITASLQPLTCFGEMIKEPLLVFQDSVESGPSDTRTPRDLIATPEDLANIWGPTSFLYDASSREHGILAIHIGGGVLLPSSPTANEILSPSLWHWRREADPGLSEAEAWSNITSKAHPVIELNTPIRIGILVCNRSCPLSKPKEQEQLRNLAQAYLHVIAAFAPHWELTTVQAGVQAFQWVTPQFMAGWSKFPGQTRKQDIVRPGSVSFISELSDASGVLVCLCTGIAQRVPLQVVVAKCMASYMNDLFPYMADWSILRDSYQMITAFENPETDLSEWQKKLPEELREPAGTIVKMILNRLQHTGIDHENVLNVAWPRAERGFDSLKIPCLGENTWIKILTDSLDNATFACITPSCLSLRLNTPSTRHKCPGTVPKAWDARRPYCLATQVCLTLRHQEGASELILDDLKLQVGRQYWIGPDDLMLVATCIEQNGELMLQIKRIKVPIRTFKRIIKKSTIRETNDRGASECLVVATTI